MDMRMFDSAIARWVVQDPVVHHFQSPYNGFDGNPVYWADPSGADADNSTNRFDYDGLGRARYDEHGWYIDPTRRGQARPDVLEMLAAIDKVSGGGSGKVISSDDTGSWIRHKVGNESKVIYDFDGNFKTLAEVVLMPVYSYEFVANNSQSYDLNNINNMLNVTGFVFSELSYLTANNSSWIGSKGKFFSTEILNKQINGKYINGVKGYRNGYKSALKIAGNYKAAGNIVGAFGIGVSLVDMGVNGVNASNSLDLIFGAASFIPVYGWAISGAYFLINAGIQASTGKNIGQLIEGK
jgi:hypothetical protein